MYSIIQAERSFSNNNSHSSSTSAPDVRSQPKISVLKENRLEPRIDIHSIDYEFPLQTKNRESSGNRHVGNENSNPVFSLRNNEYAAPDGKAKPSGTAPVVFHSQQHEEKIAADAANTVDSGDMSGMTITSFMESIRWNDHAALKMHMEAGFQGDMALMLGPVESNPIEFAMECGQFDAAVILLPQTKPIFLMEAINKRQEFFDRHPDLGLHLFRALFAPVQVGTGLNGAV